MNTKAKHPREHIVYNLSRRAYLFRVGNHHMRELWQPPRPDVKHSEGRPLWSKQS